MDNREWFAKAQYGMMAHWGLYSLLGRIPSLSAEVLKKAAELMK